MHYSTFRLQVIFRLLLIIGLGYTAIYVLTETHFWLVSFWVILAAVISVVELLRYIERSHRELENLVTAIYQGDFTNTYHQQKYKSSELLAYSYNRLVGTYQQLRQEKESNHQYLQNVVEHVSVALIGVNQQEEVTLVNPAAKQLLQYPVIRHLSDIKSIDKNLHQCIDQLEAGQRVMVKLVRNGRLMQLAVQASEFYLQGTYYKLISLQDLRRELEEQELASWQKLIRVLTHEIMNSVIPIANLSGMVRQNLLQTQQSTTLQLQSLDEEESQDLLESLKVIEDRSQGLANFVKAYRSITQVAQPHFREVKVADLVQRVYGLFATTLEEQGIQWYQQVSPDTLTLTLDLELIEQVLINLVKNALEALKETHHPSISLSAYRTKGNERVIELHDNGSGIPSEIAEQIFIPFFTTKPYGSGIGLSLSQQIMRMHQGAISVHSSPNDGTTFILHL
ncbi:MAG: ATP-binding protein [Tunicatimonas sp.]|uniref:sensor histidine kinase n=1 Tax=Tunicatimonas sp. TaxID=1940096 RepID=UPI003C784A43